MEIPAMVTKTTYADACAHLARLLDRVTNDRETVIITRRGGEDVALIAASELDSLFETAHLLRSPGNAIRLLTALNRAIEGTEPPSTLAELRRQVGLDGDA
jgi:antitoxin YefM